MDKLHNVTRRAAMLGAAVSTAALVVPVATVAMEHAQDDTPTSIEQLADSFREAAMKLDPRINECWLGYDELAKGPRDMRVMSVYFGRKDSPFLSPPQPRPASIPDLFEQWRDLRENRSGLGEAESAARYERYAELQAQITSMRPRTVREAAIQLVVETDDGDSDYRPAFFQRLRYIATEG